MTPTVLSDAQLDHFLQRGHVTIPQCFSRELAREWTDRAFQRLGYDRNDPTTWKVSRTHMALERQDDLKTFAPRAYAAACDLVGGEQRVKRPAMFFSEGFIVNFSEGADRPWEAPSAKSPGWHKDGNWFHHFLDSPEQALLMIFIWSDIKPRGGGTFIACDSVGVVARFLAEHPEGIAPGGFDFPGLAAQCHDFVEVTGDVGDIVLMHPYMLHAVSQNHSGIPRFITNPALSLVDPMDFNRADPCDTSPVERAVLQGLGKDRLAFAPTTPRRLIVSEQHKMQEKLRADEKAKLAALAR